jgi:hypothetical protein
MAPVTRISNPDHHLPGGALMTACAMAAVLIYVVSYGAFSTFQSAPSYPPRIAKIEEAKLDIPAAIPVDMKPVEAKALAGKKGVTMPAAEPSLSAVPVAAMKTLDGKTAAVMTEAAKPAETSDLMKPVTAAPSRIKLSAAEDVEVRIMDEKGRILAERMIHRGEAFFVPDQKNYTMTTSDAGALKVQVDGRDMPALGDPGEAMHNIPLNSKDLLEVLEE